jgi:hypothetical protein
MHHTSGTFSPACSAQDLHRKLQQNIRSDETALPPIKKKTETAASKLKVTANECIRLQIELEGIQLENDHTKQLLRSQIARADDATMKWREAEADARQCRQSMQLDADRLQVL